MNTRTVKELRDIARKLGIAGYSRLRKEELLDAIKAAESSKKTIAGASPPTKAKTTVAQKTVSTNKPARATAAAQKAGPAKAISAPVMPAGAEASEEERIESAKYLTTIAGAAAGRGRYPVDLAEDIDTLPALAEPRLTLLMQKPGVLLASWHLEPGHTARQKDLLLRLGVLADQRFHIKQEVVVNTDQGSFYFHVDHSWPPSVVYLQLGHYGRDGRFVIAIRRGIVRLPRLFTPSSLGVNWALDQTEFERAIRQSGPLGRLPGSAAPGGDSSYNLASSSPMRKG